MTIAELSALCQTRLDALFQTALKDVPALPLRESMHYALSNGGKRLRPLLIYATGRIFNAPLENYDAAAAAIEMIHTYSLIHDDLPCMDNADLRRGKPSCHKAFGEGMAVLAGDALQTLAIDTLLHAPAKLKPEQRLHMLAVLSEAGGATGMASGQALDITVMSGGEITLALLEDIYRLKTGALITACLKLGWIASNDQQEANLKALTEFGDTIGLAFQIQDDILDIEVGSLDLGKPQGLDTINNKNTYPKIAGLQAAKNRVEALYQAAMESINYLGGEAQCLRDLANHMLARKK